MFRSNHPDRGSQESRTGVVAPTFSSGRPRNVAARWVAGVSATGRPRRSPGSPSFSRRSPSAAWPHEEGRSRCPGGRQASRERFEHRASLRTATRRPLRVGAQPYRESRFRVSGVSTSVPLAPWLDRVAGEHPRAGVDYPGNWHELLEWFPDEGSCLRYLERLRWERASPVVSAARPAATGGGWPTG
jgi:hypothetical protein